MEKVTGKMRKERVFDMMEDHDGRKKCHSSAVGAKECQDGFGDYRKIPLISPGDRKHVRFLKHVWVYDMEDKWYYDRSRVEYDESSRGCVIDWQCPVTRKNTHHNKNITNFRRGSLERYILVNYEVTSEQAIRAAAGHDLVKANVSLTVKNLPTTSTQADVMRIFSKSGGEIDQVKIFHTEEGVKMGMIELQVSNLDAAYDIKKTFDGNELYDRILSVTLINNQCGDHKPKKTSVENLANLRCQTSKPSAAVAEETNTKRPIWTMVDK
ncbi:1856_t:CDS:2, partial [Acaulospora colombiana]